MIYIRGHARDYDQWRQMGLTGWGYADVLPYFKRAQHHEDGADSWNGEGGPLWVSRGRPAIRSTRPSSRPAARPAIPLTRDFNGRQQEGVGPYHLTIRNGERCSAAAPISSRLRCAGEPEGDLQRARRRILIERKRAVGVEFSAGRGKPVQRVYATAKCSCRRRASSRRTCCCCPASGRPTK